MNKKVLSLGLMLAFAGVLSLYVPREDASALVPAVHTRISVNNSGDGQGGNNFTPGGTGDSSQLSANGKYVVFNSFASNLISNDTNAKQDVFVRDLDAATTARVSVSASGVQANGDSGLGHTSGVAISQTGRYIAFTSSASNLIDGTTIAGGYQQVYLRDTRSNTLTIVTQKADGTLGNGDIASAAGVSNDGRFVLWVGSKNTNLASQGSIVGGYHLYVADMEDKTFKLLTPKDGTSLNEAALPTAQMSCDGSLIVTSSSDQLTADDTDSAFDTYLFDLRNGLTVKNLTAASNVDAKDPSISCNGNYITFASTDPVFDVAVPSTNTLTHVYMYDRIDKNYSVVDVSATGTFSNSASSGLAGIDDQGDVVFSGVNPVLGFGSTRMQKFLKHKDSGLLELVTRNAYSNSAATQTTLSRASISYDGKKVVYAVGNPANSLFIPVGGGNALTYDSNGFGDVVMSLTGL
jgi:hypothetical protein